MIIESCKDINNKILFLVHQNQKSINKIFTLCQMGSEYERQQEIFNAEAQSLLQRAKKELPITMKQVDQLLRIKANISPQILLFDPQCSSLKAKIESLNREIIAFIFIQNAQYVLDQITDALPLLSISHQHFINKFQAIVNQKIPLTSWTDIINKLRDKKITMKNCPQCFMKFLEAQYRQEKTTYQVGDNQYQDKEVIDLIGNFTADLQQKLQAIEHERSNEGHHSYSNPQIRSKEEENLQRRQKISNSLRQSTNSDKTSYQITRSHENNLAKHKQHSSIWQFFHNIDHQNRLLECEKQQIQYISNISREKLYYQARNSLNDNQLSQILKVVKSFERKIDKSKKYQGLVVKNTLFRNSFIQKIEEAFKQLGKCQASSNNNKYLVRIIYECFRAKYNPPIKRFLIQILQAIEEDIYKGKGSYLRGALSEFEKKDIEKNLESMSYLLSRLQPQRSSDFVSSQESKLERKSSSFQSAKEANQSVRQAIMYMHFKLAFFKQPPNIQFIKLSYSPSRKTVTIMISGFCSEDTNKDKEWMQMVQRLRDSQLYAYRWASGSILKVGKFILKRLFNRSSKNTFTQAFDEAQKAGIYLAQFLIEHFPDRFINLVGFSLGTRVIYCCLKHLLLRRKTNLINRVITMGGVADSAEFNQLLKQTAYPVNVLNLWSNKDHVLKYILKGWDRNITPIGLKAIGEVPGHTVRDVDLSKIVPGHLGYVDNHYLIAKIGDIIHD